MLEGIEISYALREADVTSNINERAKYTANTGMALISVANPNLDGTGAMEAVIAGASNGTLVKTITVKGIQSVTRGMVRLFVNGFSGGTPFTILIDEIDVPSVDQSAIQQAFEIKYELDYYLLAGNTIYASTENDESFTVTATGLDFTYPS
jgi:hypothetical protein